MPALQKASRMGEKAASVGFDWENDEQVWSKVEEEMTELREVPESNRERLEEELGDLLFALTSVARHLKIDPEASLRLATQKFEKRFRTMEALSREQGNELSSLNAEQLDILWNKSKSTT